MATWFSFLNSKPDNEARKLQNQPRQEVLGLHSVGFRGSAVGGPKFLWGVGHASSRDLVDNNVYRLCHMDTKSMQHNEPTN